MPGKLLSLTKDGRTQQEFPVVSLHVFIGSDSYCDLRIKHKEISAQHCLITAQKDKPALIRNLSRTSPTLVNGVEIGSKDVELKDQDVICIRHRQFKWCYDKTQEGSGAESFDTSNKGRKSWPLFKNKLVAVVPPQRRDEDVGATEKVHLGLPVREETTKKRRATVGAGPLASPSRRANKKVLAVKTGVKSARKSSSSKRKSSAKISPSSVRQSNGTPYGSAVKGRKSVKFVDTAFKRRLGKRGKESFGPPTPYRPSNTPGKAKVSLYFTPPSTLGSSAKKPMKGILKTPQSASVRTQTQTPLLPDLSVTPPGLSEPSSAAPGDESRLQTPPREEPPEIVMRSSKRSSRELRSPETTPKSAGKRQRDDESLVASERAAKLLKQEPPRAIDKKKMAALLQCHRKSLTPHPEVNARRRIFLAPGSQAPPTSKATPPLAKSRKSEPSQEVALPRRVIFGSLDSSNTKTSIYKRKKAPFKPINIERKMSLPKASVAKMTSTPSPPARKMTRATRAARASREPREKREVTDVLSALDLSRKVPPIEPAKVTTSPIADFTNVSGIKRLFSTDKTLDVRELFLEDGHEPSRMQDASSRSSLESSSRLSRRSSLKSTDSIRVDRSINSFRVEGVRELPASPTSSLSLPLSPQSLSSTSRRSLTLKAARKSSLASLDLTSPQQQSSSLSIPKENSSENPPISNLLILSNGHNNISAGPGSAFTPVRRRGRASKLESPQASASNVTLLSPLQNKAKSPGPQVVSANDSKVEQELEDNSADESLDFSLGSFDASRQKSGAISSLSLSTDSPDRSINTSNSPVKDNSLKKTSRISLRRIALKASTPKGLSKSLQYLKSEMGKKSNLSLHQMKFTSPEMKSRSSETSSPSSRRSQSQEVLDQVASVVDNSRHDLEDDKTGNEDNSLFVNVGSIRRSPEESFGGSLLPDGHSKSLTLISSSTPSKDVSVMNFSSTGKFVKKKSQSTLGQGSLLKNTRSKSSINMNLFDLDNNLKSCLTSSTPLKSNMSPTKNNKPGSNIPSINRNFIFTKRLSPIRSENINNLLEQNQLESFKPTRSSSLVDIDLFKLDKQSPSTSPSKKYNKSKREEMNTSHSLFNSSTKSLDKEASISKSVTFQNIDSLERPAHKSTRSNSSVVIDLFKLDDDASGLDSSKSRKSRRKLYEDSLESSALSMRSPNIVKSNTKETTIVEGKRSKSMPSVTFSEDFQINNSHKSISENNLSQAKPKKNTPVSIMSTRLAILKRISNTQLAEQSCSGVVALDDDDFLKESKISDSPLGSTSKLATGKTEQPPSSESPKGCLLSPKNLSVRSRKSVLDSSSISSPAKAIKPTRSNSSVNINLFRLDDSKLPSSTPTLKSVGKNRSARQQKSVEKLAVSIKKRQSESLDISNSDKATRSSSYRDIGLSPVPHGLPTSTPAKPNLQVVTPFVVNKSVNISDMSQISHLSSGESTAEGSYVLAPEGESMNPRNKKWQSLVEMPPRKTTRSTYSLNINLFGLDENPLDPTLLDSSSRKNHSAKDRSIDTTSKSTEKSFKLLKKGKSLIENNRKDSSQLKPRSKSLSSSSRQKSVTNILKTSDSTDNLSAIENSKSDLSRKSIKSNFDSPGVSLNSSSGKNVSLHKSAKDDKRNSVESSKSIGRTVGSPEYRVKISLSDSGTPKKPTRSSSTVNINLFDLDKNKSITNIYSSPKSDSDKKERSIVSPEKSNKKKSSVGSVMSAEDTPGNQDGENVAHTLLSVVPTGPGIKAISKKLSMMKTTPKPKSSRNTRSLENSLHVAGKPAGVEGVSSESSESEDSESGDILTPMKKIRIINKLRTKRKPTPRIKLSRSSAEIPLFGNANLIISSNEEDHHEQNLSTISKKSRKSKKENSTLESTRPTRSSSSVSINLFNLDKKPLVVSGSPLKDGTGQKLLRKPSFASPQREKLVSLRTNSENDETEQTGRTPASPGSPIIKPNSSHSLEINNLSNLKNNVSESDLYDSPSPLERSSSQGSKKSLKSTTEKGLLEASRPTRSSSSVNINLFDLDSESPKAKETLSSSKDGRKSLSNQRNASPLKEKLITPDQRHEKDALAESDKKTITPRSTSKTTTEYESNKSSLTVNFDEEDKVTSLARSKSRKSKKNKSLLESSRPTRSSSAVKINLFDLDSKSPKAKQSVSPSKDDRKSLSSERTASPQKEKLVTPDQRSERGALVESINKTITPRSTTKATPEYESNKSSHSESFDEKDKLTLLNQSKSRKSKKYESLLELSRPTRSSSAVDINLFDLDKESPKVSSPRKSNKKSTVENIIVSNQAKFEESLLSPVTPKESDRMATIPGSVVKRNSMRNSTVNISTPRTKPSRSSHSVDINIFNLESSKILDRSQSLESRKTPKSKSLLETSRSSTTLNISHVDLPNSHLTEELLSLSKSFDVEAESLKKLRDSSPRNGGKNISSTVVTPKLKPTRSSHAVDIDLFSIDSGKTIEKIAVKFLDKSCSLDSKKSLEVPRAARSISTNFASPSMAVNGQNVSTHGSGISPLAIAKNKKGSIASTSESGKKKSMVGQSIPDVTVKKKISVVENITPKIRLVKSPSTSVKRKSSASRTEENTKHTQTPMSADYDNHKHSQTDASDTKTARSPQAQRGSRALMVEESTNTLTPLSDHELQAKALFSPRSRRSLRQKEMDESDRTPEANLSDKTTPLSALSPKTRRSLMKKVDAKHTQTPLTQGARKDSVVSKSKSSQTHVTQTELMISSPNSETESTNDKSNKSRRSQVSDISSPINNSTNIIRSKRLALSDSVLKSSPSNNKNVLEIPTNCTPTTNTIGETSTSNEVTSPSIIKEKEKATPSKGPAQRGRPRKVNVKTRPSDDPQAGINLSPSQNTSKDISNVIKKTEVSRDDKLPLQDSTVGTSSPSKRKRGRTQIQTHLDESHLETEIVSRKLRVKEKKDSEPLLKPSPVSKRTRAKPKTTRAALADSSPAVSGEKLPPSSNEVISSLIVSDNVSKRRAATFKDEVLSPRLTRKAQNDKQENKVIEPPMPKKTRRGKPQMTSEPEVNSYQIPSQENSQEEKTSPLIIRTTRNANLITSNKVPESKSVVQEKNPELAPIKSPLKKQKQPKIVAISSPERRSRKRPAEVVTKVKRISKAPSGKGRKSLASTVAGKGLQVTFDLSADERKGNRTNSEPAAAKKRGTRTNPGLPTVESVTSKRGKPGKSEPSPAKRRGTRARPQPPTDKIKDTGDVDSVISKRSRPAKSVLSLPKISDSLSVQVRETRANPVESIASKRGRPGKSEPSPVSEKEKPPKPEINVVSKRGKLAKSETSPVKTKEEPPRPEKNGVSKGGRNGKSEPPPVNINEEEPPRPENIVLKRGRSAKSNLSPVKGIEEPPRPEKNVVPKRGRSAKSEPSPVKETQGPEKSKPEINVVSTRGRSGKSDLSPAKEIEEPPKLEKNAHSKRGRPAKSEPSKPEINLVSKRRRAGKSEPSPVKIIEESPRPENIVLKRGRPAKSKPSPVKGKEELSKPEGNVVKKGKPGKSKPPLKNIEEEDSPVKKRVRPPKLKSVVSSPVVKKGRQAKAEAVLKTTSPLLEKRNGSTTSEGPSLPKRRRPVNVEPVDEKKTNQITSPKTKKAKEIVHSPIVKRGRLAKLAASSPAAKKGKKTKIENVIPKPKSKSPEIKKNANLKTVMKASKSKVSTRVKGLSKLSLSMLQAADKGNPQFKMVESRKVLRKRKN